MPIGGLFSGLLGWLFFGAALYAWLTYKDPSVSQPKTDAMSDPGLGGGPWAHPTSSQTPVPMVFGTVRTPMPLIHYRLEGDQYRDMWLVCAVCEQWSTLLDGLVTVLGTIWLNDIPLANFPRYTTDSNIYDRNHDWARFYESGRGLNIYWSSAGKHVFVRPVDVGSTAESYAIQCTRNNVGGNGVVLKIRCIHQFEAGGTTQVWRERVFYTSEVSGSPEIEVFSGSQYFHLTQEVQNGKSTDTVEVGGTIETVHSVILPYKGTFKVLVDLTSSTAEGKLYFDSVELEDSVLQSETINSYGTAMVLIRVQDDDGSLTRPQVHGAVTGGPSNPAVALYWLLTNMEVSLGIEGLYIDDVSFTESAAKCDEYGYRFDRAYCATGSYETAIKDMLAAGRLLLGEYGGKISCIFDEVVPAESVRVVDLDTMADNTNYGDTSLQNIPNRFSIKYLDDMVDDTVQDLLLEDIELQNKAGVVNEKIIELYGVKSQSKAWELGWYHALWSQASKWLEFDMKPLLWDLSPGSVIKTTSDDDPYLNNREWMLVGFDESEPGRYRAKAIQYMRAAYAAPDYTADYPDVYLETPTPVSAPIAQIHATGGTVSVSSVATQQLPSGVARQTVTLSGIPAEAETVKVYRSSDGSSYSLLSEAQPEGATEKAITYNEAETWSYVWYKTAITRNGQETPLTGAPTKQVYVVGSEDTLPGYGRGGYGWQPYGG